MNGPPKTWLYTKIRAYVQNSLIRTFGPYMHRYDNKQLLFSMATLFFGYGFQFIGGRNANFTNLIICNNFSLQASFLNFAALFGVKSNKTNIWNLYFPPWKLVQYTIIKKQLKNGNLVFCQIARLIAIF